jgi:hypothetical protein
MFGKDKNAIVSTHLIIRVRKYMDQSPNFYLESTVADDTKAQSVVEKLNDLATLQKEENTEIKYYSVPITL